LAAKPANCLAGVRGSNGGAMFFQQKKPATCLPVGRAGAQTNPSDGEDLVAGDPL